MSDFRQNMESRFRDLEEGLDHQEEEEGCYAVA